MSPSAPHDGGATFPLWHRMFRLLWSFSWFVACRWTPPQMWRWRAFVLRRFGAQIGKHCDIRSTARIWYPPNLVMADWSMLAEDVVCYNPALIIIGQGTLISQRAHLCAASHNINVSSFSLTLRPIELSEKVWIATEAFVGPGVIVGEGAVLGARAAAFENLAPWYVYRGNPAQKIKPRPKVDFMSNALRSHQSGTEK